MKLVDLIHRTPQPEPWSEHDNIPWYDPEFSKRMLKEHLSQEHDAASRRFEVIDRQVNWIHNQLLSATPTWILDLGCGPGLYTTRLARLGHTCTGIDYSPAAIAYAEKTSLNEILSCSYQMIDLRLAEFGSNYGMVMFLYGEPNVFSRDDLVQILNKAYRALDPGGLLLLEPHTLASVVELGRGGRSWSINPSGLFSKRAHLLLEERFWDPVLQAATVRYDVIDGVNGYVDCFGQSLQGYSIEQYIALLEECGFLDATFYPSLTGETEPEGSDFLVVTAQKGE
ncbi:MAG TPA: class I SAM-dependent methyltransferase [Anaerolineaceae bacterium]|nr:class I SAM-dependent methyltransferase [Anaerolineaceae bacterium]